MNRQALKQQSKMSKVEMSKQVFTVKLFHILFMFKKVHSTRLGGGGGKGQSTKDLSRP